MNETKSDFELDDGMKCKKNVDFKSDLLGKLHCSTATRKRSKNLINRNA